MGVEPYLVSSSLEMVLAQRLVRLICKHCKEETPTTTLMRCVRSMATGAGDGVSGEGVPKLPGDGVPRAAGYFRIDAGDGGDSGADYRAA